MPQRALPDRETQLDMYETMWTIRLFEEEVANYFARGFIHGTYHLCIGQEAAETGVLCGRGPGDVAFGTHRGHGHALAFGVDPGAMMAEIFGKSTGCCGGKGGSMHMVDASVGFMNTNGVVGGSIPHAVGAALALRMQNKRDAVSYCFFGDGASNEGSFHESLNMAGLWKLPVVFVLENNFYGMSTHISESMSDTDLCKRAAPYGIPAAREDGNDFIKVFGAADIARRHAVESGPYLLILDTYRICGHSKSDTGYSYRGREEIEQWKRRCPIACARRYLEEQGAAKREIRERERRAGERIRRAVEFALAGPAPAPESAFLDVYA